MYPNIRTSSTSLLSKRRIDKILVSRRIISSSILSCFLSIIFCSCNDDLQTKYIFYPQKLKQDFKFKLVTDGKCEEVFFKTNDNISLNGIFFPAKSDKVILYFHGNQGSLDSWQSIQEYYQNLDMNFFVIDYRGFGKSGGEITEDGLYKDAKASYDYLLSKGFKSNA